MKRLLSIFVGVTLALVVSIGIAQIRSDSLFPWASGLALPGLQIGIRGPNALNGTPMAIMLHGTCDLDFTAIAAEACNDQICTATGAAENDRVLLGQEDAFTEAGNGLIQCTPIDVSPNVITVRCCNQTVAAGTSLSDPTPKTFVWSAIRP